MKIEIEISRKGDGYLRRKVLKSKKHRYEKS